MDWCCAGLTSVFICALCTGRARRNLWNICSFGESRQIENVRQGNRMRPILQHLLPQVGDFG